MSSWPFWSLLNTVFGSILEVFLLCVAGYALARRGILDKQTQKNINRVNVSLFTPSLLFSKVAFFLTPEKLRELWIIPIVFVVTTSVSMFVAFTSGSITRLKRSQRSFVMAASMFMNSNSLPIALMQSLVYTVKGLNWGDDDTKDAMLGRALTYLVLYSTLGMVLRWSYGVHLLSQADDGDTPSPASQLSREPTETSPLISGISLPPTHYPGDQPLGKSPLFLTQTHESSSSAGSSIPNRPYDPSRLYLDASHPDQGIRHTFEGARRKADFFYSFPNTPAEPHSEASSVSDLSDDEDLLADGAPLPRRRRIWCIRTSLQKFLNFMTVPMWAALASLIVACVGPLQHALEQHMRPVKTTLTAAGNCSIPLTLVVLGAYFYVPPEDGDDGLARNIHLRTLKARISDQSLVQSFRRMFVFRGRSSRQGIPRSHAGVGKDDINDSRPGETKAVILSVLSRMILTPLVLLPLLALLIASGANSMFEDPVFVMSCVLLITSPPALTLAQVTQAASGDAFERLISRTIFWAYCVVTPPSTLVSVVVGLLLSKS